MHLYQTVFVAAAAAAAASSSAFKRAARTTSANAVVGSARFFPPLTLLFREAGRGESPVSVSSSEEYCVIVNALRRFARRTIINGGVEVGYTSFDCVFEFSACVETFLDGWKEICSCGGVAGEPDVFQCFLEISTAVDVVPLRWVCKWDPLGEEI